MSDREEVRLGDLASIQTGPFGSQLHAEDYVEDGVPSIMPKMAKLTTELAEQMKQGEVLDARIRENMTKVGYEI